MARKRHSDEDILKLFRDIEARLASGSEVSAACRAAEISDVTDAVDKFSCSSTV